MVLRFTHYGVHLFLSLSLRLYLYASGKSSKSSELP